MQRNLVAKFSSSSLKGKSSTFLSHSSYSFTLSNINGSAGNNLISRRSYAKNQYKKKQNLEPVYKLNFEDFEQQLEEFKEEVKIKPAKDFKLPSQPFRLVAGVILERYPVVTPEPEPWFTEHTANLEEIEAERQKKQDEIATLRAEMEMKLRAKKARGKKDDKKAVAAAAKAAAEKAKKDRGQVDMDEEEEEEVDTTIYPVITPDDEANNRKSLYRKLRNRLYLIVKKDRADHAWQFPQGEYEEVDGDLLRRTAEREFTEELGKELDVYYLGNAPITHHVYSAANKQTKVFFYKAHYVNGKPILNQKELSDYLWVTKEEMKEYLSPDLYAAVENVLLD